MALAHAAGIALPLFRGPFPWPLLAPLLLASLILLWRRPWPLGVLLAVAVGGMASGSAFLKAELRDCRLHLPSTWEGVIEGRFLTRPAPGATFPFRLEAGGPMECRGVVRATIPAGAFPPRAGERVRTAARWEGRGFPQPGRAEWSGRLRLEGGQDGSARSGPQSAPQVRSESELGGAPADGLRVGSEGAWQTVPGGGLSGVVLLLRGRVQERMVRLWGEDAPVVEALVLARREHLDPALREAFALSGTAHLLAISGFHVGVVAGLLLGILRLAGLRPRGAQAGAAAGCWLYVLAIGAPHAAVRAALLLSLLVAARLRGRPVVSVGALGSALLLLLAVNPGWLASVGFQLSFAGTGGLALLREPVGRGVEAVWRWASGRPLPRGREPGIGAGLLRGSAGGVTAGVAATLPTLPLLAWHFDRISLVGVPATLLVAPIVAMSIPGIGMSLLASVFSFGLGSFLAGGTGILLQGAGRLVVAAAELPGASIWVSRGALVAALVGGGVVHLFLRRWYPGRVGPPVRRAAAVGAGSALVLLLPLLPLGGTLELHMIDVGQGDAVALRFPSGRWLLVDAGPSGPGFDAGARRVVPYLKRQGVRRLDAVVLTHPHLDHIGGARAVFREIEVRGVLDPSRPHGSRPYLQVIEAAGDLRIWWWRAVEGRSFEIDDVRIEVLHPDPATLAAEDLDDPNDLSVVLLVQWGRAAVLLTGDAPAEVERQILERVPPLTVLKVGHHGSRTSTSGDLLAIARPAAAVIGVGGGNSFGHPHEVVTDRLALSGVPIFRTDRDGDIRIRLRQDGSMEVSAAR